MFTANKLLDSTIKQRLMVDKVENRILRETIKLFKALEKELKVKILELDEDDPLREKKRKMEIKIRDIQESISAASRELGKKYRGELLELGSISVFATVADIEGALPFLWSAKAITKEQLTAIVDSQPFQGAILKNWSSELKNSVVRKMEKSLQVGLLSGESIPKMAARIKPVLNVATKQAAAIVRSAVNHVSNHARNLTFKKNTDIVKKVIWWATLDNRTSGICRANHGTKYSLEDSANLLPAHFQCRSVWVPEAKGWEELIEGFKGLPPEKVPFSIRVPNERNNKKEIRRWLSKQGIKPIPGGKKKDLLSQVEDIVGSYREDLKGRVSEKLSYHEWLATQPDFVIRDVYGPKRLELYKKGEAKLEDFDSRATGLLTGEQLAKKLGLEKNPIM